MCCKIRMQPKKFHRAKTKGIPRIDVSKMSRPDLMEQFAQTFEKEFGSLQPSDSATEKWEALRDTMYGIALATFGKRSSKSHDWFEAKSAVMTPVIEVKRAALAECKHTPSEKNLQILRIARSKAQQTARRYANEYWTELCQNNQSATITGNIRGMYDDIKKALGPTLNKTAPLRSSTAEVITDRGHQLERWLEHCVTLCRWCYRMPADHGRTRHRANKAIVSLASGKAPGSDGISPDLFKHCKTTSLHSLHVLLCQCWQEGAVPQDMRDAKIITLFKNKGERSDCKNYRGISLLSVIGKVFSKVILILLQELAERVYPEPQCGFRAGRSTVDMVFCLCQLQEKCREQQMPLYIAFIDLTKAFDLVSRDGLFQIFPKIGCPPKLKSMIESLHKNIKGTAQFNDSSSRPFDIRSGVRQGCVLTTTLFGIFFALLLRHAFGTASDGICLQTRADGRLFNLGRLRAKTKVRETLIKDMLFADDAAVTTHTQQELQALMDCFSQACKYFGLTISLKKTNVLRQDTMELPAITIDDYELDVVEQFTYLGSTITDNLSLDTEIDKRIGKAATTLARLTSRVWTNHKLTVKTTMVVYIACVASTLMYGSELLTDHDRIVSIDWGDPSHQTYINTQTNHNILDQAIMNLIDHDRILSQ